MNKQDIEKQVEYYLNGQTQELSIDYNMGKTAQEQFELHTVKRLQKAFQLGKQGSAAQEDFLLSLRDYLLVFDANISLPHFDIPANNAYSIAKDVQTGKYFASYQFPTYVNARFAKAAFGKENETQLVHPQNYDLYTDPLIYKLMGYTKFKTMAQKLAVYGALNTPEGYTTLVSLPTGGGKSLITQTLAYQHSGLTIVIVPTVSLAIDQVRVAQKNIHSENVKEEVFSYSSGVDATPIIRAIQEKKARLLFISPEALINNQRFVDVVAEANKSRYLKNIVIDEAHIVVEWGAAFRVDYQCLESWRKKLMRTNPLIRTILLSATYEQSCVRTLKELFSDAGKWIEIRCDSLRHEPRYMLVQAKSGIDKNQKMLEMVRKLPHPMIIYVARPIEAEEIQKYLFKHGIHNVRTFTGLTNGQQRKNLIDQWVDDQFEIMVATSAFGVGVDKSDVRTVLHMYVPPNPNAYYQELGRGGRDRMPCLSVMCIHQEDLNISFNRISKKVLTPEKILGRWDSMYNSPRSKRMGNWIFMDTTVKPSYNIEDVYDDSPASDADMNWNIYVLLFLRRYGLIRIEEITTTFNQYIFHIEIVNDLLRNDSLERTALIEKVRAKEWDGYCQSYTLMKDAIRCHNRFCWSEMFYDTYDKVSEYCAGCGVHDDPIEGDFYEFPLKLSVREPVQKLEADQLALVGGMHQAIVFVEKNMQQQLLDKLLEKRLHTVIASPNFETEQYLQQTTKNQNLLIINQNEFHELMKKSSYYYVSGLVAVLYDGDDKTVYNTLRMVDQYLGKRPDVRIVHVLEENRYFSTLNKAFADLVDGPVIPVDEVLSK